MSLGPCVSLPGPAILGDGEGGLDRSAVFHVRRLTASGKGLSVSVFRVGAGPKRAPLLDWLPLQAPSRQRCPSLVHVSPGACGDHRQAVGKCLMAVRRVC